MDPDVEIMFVVPSKDLVRRCNLSVKLSEEFNREKLTDDEEMNIDTVWNEKLKNNSKIWNGTKFRIASVLCVNDTVVFNLGITCYKDFIGTNWSPFAKCYKKLGEKKFGHSQAFMSDALGVGSIVQTRDDYVVLIKRSMHCAEAVGLWDIPGGHPEPEKLVGRIAASEIDISSLDVRAVVNEIFDSTLREICDEINVPLCSLTDPLLMGVGRNTTSAGRPSSEYFVKCNLTSEEIRNLYKEGGHLDAEESTNIMFVPTSEIMHLQENRELWQNMAPSAKGCFILYQKVVFHPDKKYGEPYIIRTRDIYVFV